MRASIRGMGRKIVMKPWAWLNWAIAALLVATGVFLVRWPHIMESADSSAILAGALFGAAALFVGAEITKRDQYLHAQESMEETRAKLRTALMGELVSIMVNHMESAKFFRRAATELAAAGAHRPVIDLTQYMPPEFMTYRALIGQIICLTSEEVDTLTIFQSGLELTRMDLRKAAPDGAMGLLQAENLASMCEHDCLMAADVVALLAPHRQIQREGQAPILLTEALQTAAGRRPAHRA
jgi:hypothetical protein